jgi:hypothetical protein
MSMKGGFVMVEPTEYTVPDIKPASFVIEILDDEHEPVEEVKFDVSIDDGNTVTKQTNKEGVFNVAKPQSEVQLSFAE